MTYKRLLKKFVFAIGCLVATNFASNEEPKFEFMGGGSLGYPSVINLTFGTAYKRKIYLEVSPGIWSYPDEHSVKSFANLYIQYNYASLGIASILYTGKRNVFNPGVLLSLDPMKFGIKVSLDLYACLPISSEKIEDIINVRLKWLLLEW